MKLVDILARELKVWPDGALYAWQSEFNSEVYFEGASVDIFHASGNAEDSGTEGAEVTRAQWQAAVDALKAESRPTESMALHHQEVGRITRQWNGELPPVGLPCQWYSDSQTGWQEVVVLAYSGESAWIQPKGKPSIIVGNPANFLPLRTPEQIAKQERSKACDKMYGVILDKIPQDRRNNGSDICEALYDAGYRKFEIVDN